MGEIKTVPRIESLRGVIKFVQNPLPVIDAALKTYGKTYFTRIVGGRKLLMTTDVDITQHVLQLNNKNYIKSEIQTESLAKYVGLGLLTANGDYWLRQRRLIQPGFKKSKLSGLINIMELEIVKFYNELEERVGLNSKVDISEAMMELTLRVVSKSLFGKGINEDQINLLGKTIHALQQHIIKEIRQPMLNWWRSIRGQNRKALSLAANVRQMMQVIIDERRASRQEQDDLLDMLLSSRYEDTGEGMTDRQILDEAIILFVAGHETTANTLAWCIHALRENTGARNTLRQEILSSPLYEEAYNMDTLMAPSYLGQVLDETMRLYPAAWILDRKALQDETIDNINIQKGDMIGLYVFGTHRDPDLWPDPERFDPSRFGPEKKKHHHKFAFYPFGGGPRMCIGYHFAMMEMKIAIAEFIKRFELPSPSGMEPELKPLITLKPIENIVCKLALRKNKFPKL